MLRIIAGKAKGRRLAVPKGLGTRPTSARAREALFALLGEQVAGAQVLDLFAGSGALGLEALSRGATAAVLVDSAAAAIACLRRNAAPWGPAAEVMPMPAWAALAVLARRGRRFDLVFLDPPYDRGLLAPALARLTALALLQPAAVVLCEHARRLAVPTPPEGLLYARGRTFGEATLSLFAARERRSP